MNPTHLILDNVTKQFGEQKAVNQVNLTLQAGECVGLAGHNGAGKSTMMKLILGLIRPSEGKITLFGEDISNGHSAQSAICPKSSPCTRRSPAKRPWIFTPNSKARICR